MVGSPNIAKDAYDAIVNENKALRARMVLLEKQHKKKRKRPPNAYQVEWARQYKNEVMRAKSAEATDSTLFFGVHLIAYTKQYGDTMNTSPCPKNGEALADEDRKNFMKNVAERAKAVRKNDVAEAQGAEATTTETPAQEVSVRT
jgi:hypothetical protein